MKKKSPTKNINVMAYQSLQSCTSKYLVVVVNRGMASNVSPFNLLKEAKKAFKEIARSYRYEPEEINGSDYYDVSIWELTEDRYEKVYIYI